MRTPLHELGEWLRDFFVTIPPGVVKGVFVLLYVALLIWVLRLPRARVVDPEGGSPVFGNLKVWAAVALGLQILIYLVL